MLTPPATTWITHGDFYHLGDVINVVQQAHHYSNRSGEYRMFSRGPCPCCGGDTEKMLQQIISLLDTNLKFSKKSSPNAEVFTPAWVKPHKRNPWDRLPYVKAKRMPATRTHVVCQFDGRSRGDKVPAWNQIVKLIKPKWFNIGDRAIPCQDKTELDLIAKFRLIASAKLYVGIDSGLTHLALMTNTPILLVHPAGWDARRFYPETDQIEYKAV